MRRGTHMHVSCNNLYGHFVKENHLKINASWPLKGCASSPYFPCLLNTDAMPIKRWWNWWSLNGNTVLPDLCRKESSAGMCHAHTFFITVKDLIKFFRMGSIPTFTSTCYDSCTSKSPSAGLATALLTARAVPALQLVRCVGLNWGIRMAKMFYSYL